MVKWVIWYADGSSFSSLEGEPHEAPAWGVICVAEHSGEHGRMLWHGTDFYCWDYLNRSWVSCDSAGLLDYLANIKAAQKCVRIGRHVSPDAFHRVFAVADKDPRLLPRTSVDALEQRRPQL